MEVFVYVRLEQRVVHHERLCDISNCFLDKARAARTLDDLKLLEDGNNAADLQKGGGEVCGRGGV